MVINQSENGLRNNLSNLTSSQVAQIANTYAMPQELGQLFMHPAPRLDKFPKMMMIDFIALEAGKYILKYFSIDNTPDLESLRDYADLVLEDFGDMRIIEIKEIFRRAVKETVYNRIDVNVLFQWTAKYYARRAEYVSIQREQYHKRISEAKINEDETDDIASQEQVAAIMKEYWIKKKKTFREEKEIDTWKERNKEFGDMRLQMFHASILDAVIQKLIPAFMSN